MTEELLAAAGLGQELTRRLFGDLAYRSEALEGTALAESRILLVTDRSRQGGKRQHVENLSKLRRATTQIIGLSATNRRKMCHTADAVEPAAS